MKGIELLTMQRDAAVIAGNTVDSGVLAHEISSARASIAELYMTDLWYF